MTTRHAHQPDILASTGKRLAARLSLIGAALEADAIPTSLGHPLAKAVDKLQAGLARRSALAQLQRLLDPHQQQSLWWLACELNTRLERFRGAGLRRVKSDARLPDAIEQSLLALIDSGAQSAYRIWLELQDLTLRR